MSALGQKRTYAAQKAMSAFPPRPDIRNSGSIFRFWTVAALQMIDDYEIVFGASDDIPGILTIQEANLPHNGGSLSVRLSADWFQRAILEQSLIVCRREGGVVGYLLGASLAAWGNVPIIQAMLCAKLY